MELELHPDRLFPTDPAVRSIARRLYDDISELPIISPHGHVDPGIIADDTQFGDPAGLFVVPDHYITRLLHAHGVSYDVIYGDTDPRELWRIFCSHWWAFRGTPMRVWLEASLVDVFGVRLRPSAETADQLYDQLSERLEDKDFRPRALFDKFRLEVLATTDDPCDDLSTHQRIAADASFSGRVIPTFRPDAYLDPTRPDWLDKVAKLGDVSGEDIQTYEGFIAGLEKRRAYFKEHGATATDHGSDDAVARPLEFSDAKRAYLRSLSGTAGPQEKQAFRQHMLAEMARMSSEDGLVMQLHPGVLRNYDTATFRKFGPDTGHDIPAVTEYTKSLRPLLEAYGRHPNFRIVLFTVDEDVFSREIAPLAGFYPSVYVGAPWWFLDSPDAIGRWRSAVTDSAGFHKTAGFVDDTRAYCSIPVRHDMARRLDCRFLAQLVAEHRLPEDEAAETARDLAYAIPARTFRVV